MRSAPNRPRALVTWAHLEVLDSQLVGAVHVSKRQDGDGKHRRDGRRQQAANEARQGEHYAVDGDALLQQHQHNHSRAAL